MKNVGIVANPTKKDALAVVRKVLPLFAPDAWNVLLEPWIAENLKIKGQTKSRREVLDQSDFVLVLGGDGTLLAAARDLNGKATPLLGVNLGGLGFLTEVTVDGLPAFLNDVFNGRSRIEKRETLEAAVLRSDKVLEKYRALNEVVVGKGTLFRLLKLEVTIGSEHLTHFAADGLIVATPTGSTAYSLSAGGPILHPEVFAFVLTPICPHSLTSRPLVIPMDKELTVRVKTQNENTMLTCDGQQGMQLVAGDEIKIRRSENPVHLMLSQQSSYFDVLREKLHWGSVR